MLGPALQHAFEQLPTASVRVDPKLYEQTLMEPSMNLLKALVPSQTTEMLNVIEPALKTLVATQFTEQIGNFGMNVAASIAPPTIEIPLALRTEIIELIRSNFTDQTTNLTRAVRDALRPPTDAVVAQFLADMRPRLEAQFKTISNEFCARLTPIPLPAPPVPFTLPSPFPMALTVESQMALATATSERIMNNPAALAAETARVVQLDLLPTVRGLIKTEMDALRKKVLELVRDRLPPAGEMALA